MNKYISKSKRKSSPESTFLAVRPRSITKHNSNNPNDHDSKKTDSKSTGLPSGFNSALNQPKQDQSQPLPQENHQDSLPGSLKSGLESLSGIDLTSIRVHKNSSKPDQFDALAYTQGKNIYLSPGQENQLPHESWHAVQQLQGRVPSNSPHGKGVPQQEQNLEQEANSMGAKAIAIGENAGIGTRPLDLKKISNTKTAIQLRPRKKKKSRAKAKVERENALIADATWIADSLLTQSLPDAIKILDSVESLDLMISILKRVEDFGPQETKEAEQRFVSLRMEIINRIKQFEHNQRAYESFIKLILKIRRAPGRKITPAHEADLASLLDSVGPPMLKRMEKEIMLWPKSGKPTKMRRLIELVTERTRLSPGEESKRGRFDLAEGEKITESLQNKVVDMTAEVQADIDKKNVASNARGEGDITLTGKEFNKCLKLLSSITARRQLHAGQDAATLNARINYEKGIRERKKDLHKDATLTRYAQELRMEHLVGPVKIVPVKGKKKPHHVPAMTDILDELSSAGDGWYYFYISVVSHHTVLVAIKSEGGSKDYFLIQMPPSKIPGARSKRGLEKFFDGWRRHGAASKVWPVYAKPAV